MKASPTYAVQYRRKRIGKTDYKTRLKLLRSGERRLAIRRSLKNIWLQIIEFAPAGDRIIASAHSRELKKLGWKAGMNNLPAAYLCGLLLAKKARAKKITSAVLDIGLSVSVKGAVWYAALKGVVDGGISVPHAKEILPDEKRIRGEHIAAWAKIARSEPEKYKRVFNNYVKAGIQAENLPAHFEEIKRKITQ